MIPFSFALSNTNLHGLLFNPFGTSVSGGVANAVLAALDDNEKRQYDLMEPTGAVRVIGYNVQSDAADCELSFGVYDTEASAFVEIQPVYATDVAAGGLTRSYSGAGFLLPTSATKIACLKYTPGSGSANVTGDIDIQVIQGTNVPSGVGPVIPTQNILDDAGLNVLDDADGIVVQG